MEEALVLPRQTIRHQSIMASGHDKFHHPYQPYDIQLEFMNALYECIDQGQVGIFESPTGLSAVDRLGKEDVAEACSRNGTRPLSSILHISSTLPFLCKYRILIYRNRIFKELALCFCFKPMLIFEPRGSSYVGQVLEPHMWVADVAERPPTR